jgi:hypothetical protein
VRWEESPTARGDPSGRVKETAGKDLGVKKGTSAGKLASLTSRPVHPESAMSGVGLRTADRIVGCLGGWDESELGGEKGRGVVTWRPRESSVTRKTGEAGRGVSREAKGEGRIKGGFLVVRWGGNVIFVRGGG